MLTMCLNLMCHRLLLILGESYLHRPRSYLRSPLTSLVGGGGCLADDLSCHDVDAVMSGRFWMIWCPDAGFLF